MKRKPDSTYPVGRKKARAPYRKQDILPKVEKCAYCGITRRQRKIDVRDYGEETPYLVCDRCVVEAARGAKMDPDKDEWLSPGRPRVQLIGKGRHEYGSQLREPDGKFTVRG